MRLAMTQAPSACLAVHRRLAALRITLGVCCILVVVHSYDEFLPRAEPLLYHPGGILQGLPPLGKWFKPLTILCCVASALFLFGIGGRTMGIPLILSFGTLEFYVTRFCPDVWNYRTHLLFFLFIVLLADSNCCFSLFPTAPRWRPLSNERLLSFMQIIVANVYLCSFVAKLSASGIAWFVSGDTARGAVIDAGLPFGDWLLNHAWLLQLGSSMTGFLELMTCFLELLLPVLICCRRTQKCAGLAAFAFHAVTWAALGISFWHLWAFFPGLFWLWNSGAVGAHSSRVIAGRIGAV
jgi:hypothetical protein